MPDSKPHKTYFILAAPGIAGIALVLFVTSRYGAGTTSDSVNYIAAARSLAAGRGLLCSDLEPFTSWPPLFPALLALIDLTAGLDPLRSVRWVNALCFGTVIFLSGAWVRQRTGSSVAAAICSLSVLLSFTLVMVSRMAWSEPLFMLFTMGFLMAADGFMRSKNPRFLYLAAALAGAAFLTRYVGITLVLTGLVLVLIHREMKVREKAWPALVFLIVSVVPMVFWIGRNFLVSGTFSGHQYPFTPTPWINLVHTAAAISKWLLPAGVPGAARVLLAGAAITAPAVLLFHRTSREREAERRLFHSTFLPLVLYIIIYTSLLAFSRSGLAFYLIGDRYLSPLYAPLLVYLVIFGFRAAALLEERKPILRARFVFVVIFCAWLFHPGPQTVRISLGFHERGAGGYAKPKWQDSETARFLRETPLDGPVFSNDPQAAYILASVHARWSAYKHPYNSPAGESNLSRFLQSCEGGHLAWFDYRAKRFYTADELKEFVDLEPRAIFSDGGVYKISGKNSR